MNYTDSDPIISNAWKISVNTFIIIFGLFGNILLVTSLLKSRKIRHSMTNMLILNLAFCDITIVAVSVTADIIQLHYDYFPFGEIGCRILYPLTTLVLISVVFTLVVLATERYIAIVHPFRYQRLKKFAIPAIACIHLMSIVCVSPYAYHLELTEADGISWCSEKWSTYSSAVYTVFLFSIQYAVPLPIIVGLYSVGWYQMKKKNDEIIRVAEQQRGRVGPIDEELLAKARFELIQTYMKAKQKNWLFQIFHRVSRRRQYTTQLALTRQKQTLSMLKSFICVITVFAIFMLPNQITWLCRTVGSSDVSNEWTTVAYWLTYANSILNPIIYGINRKFRRAYLSQIRQFISFCCQSFGRSRLNSTSSAFDGVFTGLDCSVSESGSRFMRHKRFVSERFRSDSVDSNDSSFLICSRSNSITSTENSIGKPCNDNVDRTFFYYTDCIPRRNRLAYDDLNEISSPDERQNKVPKLSRRCELYRTVLEGSIRRNGTPFLFSSTSEQSIRRNDSPTQRKGLFEYISDIGDTVKKNSTDESNKTHDLDDDCLSVDVMREAKGLTNHGDASVSEIGEKRTERLLIEFFDNKRISLLFDRKYLHVLRSLSETKC